MFTVCMKNNTSGEEVILKNLDVPEDWDPEDCLIGPDGEVWDTYDPAEWTAELFDGELKEQLA